MTRVKFLLKDERVVGFELNGHSSANASDQEGKIVCAAISSAAYMTANTVTEIIGDSCEIEVDEARMFLKVNSPTAKTSAVLEGFKLHITELSKQYSKRIKIITEV